MQVDWRKKFGVIESNESRQPAPSGPAKQEEPSESSIKRSSQSSQSTQSSKVTYSRSKDPKLLDLRLIHVGKSGGSTVCQTLGINQYHTVKPRFSSNEQYVLWLRNPISRFVACFNMSKYCYYWNNRSEELRIRCGFPDLGDNPLRPERPEGNNFPIQPPAYEYMINYFESRQKLIWKVR